MKQIKLFLIPVFFIVFACETPNKTSGGGSSSGGTEKVATATTPSIFYGNYCLPYSKGGWDFTREDLMGLQGYVKGAEFSLGTTRLNRGKVVDEVGTAHLSDSLDINQIKIKNMTPVTIVDVYYGDGTIVPVSVPIRIYLLFREDGIDCVLPYNLDDKKGIYFCNIPMRGEAFARHLMYDGDILEISESCVQSYFVADIKSLIGKSRKVRKEPGTTIAKTVRNR